MKKTVLPIALSILMIAFFTACSDGTQNKKNEDSTNTEIASEQEQEVEESPLGNFSILVGEWTVDAATAGVQLDLIFGDDGSFNQKMGEINADGTWEVVDEEHIKILTPNTTGQTWLVTNLTETTVSFCWNPDSPKPKTIPMERVK